MLKNIIIILFMSRANNKVISKSEVIIIDHTGHANVKYPMNEYYKKLE